MPGKRVTLQARWTLASQELSTPHAHTLIVCLFIILFFFSIEGSWSRRVPLLPWLSYVHIRHLHISHNAPYFLFSPPHPPPHARPKKFASPLSFISPGHYRCPKENWKRCLCKIRYIMGDVQLVNWCIKGSLGEMTLEKEVWINRWDFHTSAQGRVRNSKFSFIKPFSLLSL